MPSSHEVVYCCPCMLHLIKKEIEKKEQLMYNLLLLKTNISIEILVEDFEDSVLVACYNHIKECFYLDDKFCNHFNRMKVFSYTIESWEVIRKCFDSAKKFLFNYKSNFYTISLNV